MNAIDKNIGGVIAAVPTPVDTDNQVKLEYFLAHCKWALENGCDGLNILGTTGEANSQSVESRKSVMKMAATHLDPSCLMVGTGIPDLETTISLSRYADELGYPVVLILPPYYYKPVTDEGLFEYFQKLDSGLNGCQIKVYLYNFPALTGIKYSVDLIARLAQAFPDRISGIKDSSADLPYCREIVARVPGFKVFPSSETSLSQARQEGFAGCISATVNVTGPVSAKIWSSKTGADTENLTKILEELRSGISAVPLVPAVKYLIGLREKNSDWKNTLPPLQSLRDDQQEILSGIASRLGYL